MKMGRSLSGGVRGENIEGASFDKSLGQSHVYFHHNSVRLNSMEQIPKINNFHNLISLLKSE